MTNEIEITLNSNSSNNNPIKYKNLSIFYSTIIVCLSSFFFGFCLTSSDFFINNFNDKNKEQLTSTEISWFLSINLLGALLGNIFISSFHFNRKLSIILNNLNYKIGILIIYFFNYPILIIIGKFLIGISIGITCAYVPSYLSELSNSKYRGVIGCIHPLLITIGVVIGYLLEISFNTFRIYGLIIILLFLIIHSILMIIILSPIIEKKGKNLKSLLLLKASHKSIIFASIFHFTQQASGVNVVLICSKSILTKTTGFDDNDSIFVALSQFITTALSIGFINKFGRKPLMIISVIGVIISLLIIILSNFVKIGMYSFMIFYSFGLGPVTWFITGEIVPLEYRDSTNQIATSINWFFGFLTVVTQEYLFNKMDKNMFYIYLSIMCIYLIYLIKFFKETRGTPINFLK